MYCCHIWAMAKAGKSIPSLGFTTKITFHILALWSLSSKFPLTRVSNTCTCTYNQGIAKHLSPIDYPIQQSRIVSTCLIVQCMTSLGSSNNCKKTHTRNKLVALYYVRTRKRQESLPVPPMQIRAYTDTHRYTSLYTCAGMSEAYAL